LISVNSLISEFITAQPFFANIFSNKIIVSFPNNTGWGNALGSYGPKNIESVFNAISYLGHKPIVILDLNKIKFASHLILPGVGNFFKAAEKIKLLNYYNT
jgi:hypothetical protein